MAKKNSSGKKPDIRRDPSTGITHDVNSTRGEDIHDSERDQERLKQDEAYIDLPDVKDIPGQEFIHVPGLGELADTTISSDDEEGVGIFGDDEDDETLITSGTENDLSHTDREMLANMDHLQGVEDDQGVQKASLDNEDFEGDELNESVDTAGTDLDVSGAEDDDRMENIGEEDEENNQWSRGSDRNDNMNEGTP